MLCIRLSRSGRKNLAQFKLVVQQKVKSPKSNFVEIIGAFNPHEENGLSVKKERLEYFLKHGAKPSNTVARLLKKAGFEGMDAFMNPYTKVVKEPTEEEKAAIEKEAAEKAAADTPAEDKKEEVKEEAASAEEAKEEAPASEEKKEEAPAAEEKAEQSPAEEKKEEVKEEAPAAEEKNEEAPAEEKKEEAEPAPY